jgi:hypothetical protein
MTTRNDEEKAMPANQALVQRQDGAMAVSGTFSEPHKVTAMLERRGKDFHLVAPTTECSLVPEGCSVSFAAVLIDVATETYNENGRRALHRVALDKIAAAAGISWDSRLSGRIDDRSDPLYCLFRSVGHIRQFDGTTIDIIGTKEMSLRDGDPMAEDCIDRGKPDELKMMRKHIVAHAETKSRLRAIASMGIRRSYTAEELKKPFVCAKLSFTGETKDPELRRAFALRRADALLGASQGLFGAPPSLPDAEPIARGVAPPPVGSSIEDADFEEEEPGPPRRRASPVAGPHVPPPATAPAQGAPPPYGPPSGQGSRGAPPQYAPPPDAGQTQRGPGAPQAGRQESMPYGGAPAPAGKPRRSGLVLPGGPNKGQAVEDASDESLAYWSKRIAGGLDAGTARRGDRELYEAMCAEIEWRVGGEMGAAADDRDDDNIPF